VLNKSDHQISVKFDPASISDLVTCGAKTIYFWTWKDFSIEGYAGKASKTDLGHFSGSYTGTIFLQGTDKCLTATSDGYVIVWGNHIGVSKTAEQRKLRTASKVR
jgi:hypothetical protein